eukprot:6483241-Amphidinium_carterae.1
MAPKHGIQHALARRRPAVKKQLLKKPAQRQPRPRVFVRNPNLPDVAYTPAAQAGLVQHPRPRPLPAQGILGLSAMSPMQCHQYLVQQRLLNDHVCCPICFHELGPWGVDGDFGRGSQTPFARCKHKGCQKKVYATHGSCLFDNNNGLVLQACILFALVLPSTINKTLQMLEGRFTVSRQYVGKVLVRLRAVIAQYVLAEQKHMRFTLGAASATIQLEADESYFGLRKGDETCGEPGEEVEFVAFIGVMARGMPDSLVLHARDPQHCTTIRAANGRARPPPLSREEWLSVVQAHIPTGTNV